MREKTCCFTGHRNVPEVDRQGIMENTEGKIRELIAVGYRYFGVGGAVGYDALASEILFRLRKTEFPEIKVILVYPFDGFTRHWSADQKRAYAERLSDYDKVVREAEKPDKGAYLARNRHLVDWSSYCICYLTKTFGGTAYTVDYAEKQGLHIHNVAAGVHCQRRKNCPCFLGPLPL